MHQGFAQKNSMDRPHPQPPPGALVVGGDFLGLGIARSLGRHGVPVCVIDDEPSITRYSRYVDHAVRVEDLRDEDRAVEALLAAGRDLGLDGWVLFPTRDETVVACARRREELSRQYRLTVPDWDTVRWAADKRLTYRLADELGVPAPRTIATDEGDPGHGEFPLVVKPAFKPPFIYATGVKAWRVNTQDELWARIEQAGGVISPDEVIVQEYVPGDGLQQHAFCALVSDGKPVASMVVNRRRQHPPEFGRASTFVQTVDMPEIERLAERFLAAIRYDGLVELEFKVDPRDGRPKLLDVNARSWGYHSLGQRAGVDFPTLMYRQCLGEKLATGRAGAGVSWIRLLTDIPTSTAEIAQGRLGISSFLRSLRQSDSEPVFSRRDPLPGLAELVLLPHLVRSRGLSVGDSS